MKTYYIESLGCSKNLVDSEILNKMFENANYKATSVEKAEIIVVNTCGFINPAKEEAIDTILNFSELKKNGNCKKIIATGCLVKRYFEELKETLSEVDEFVNLKDFDKFSDILDIQKVVKRKLMTPKHYAFLRISDGCDNHCSYCAIPGIRGDLRSVPMEKLIDEAKTIAAQGVKELIITAQDTANYGTDIYSEKSLPKLLEELVKIKGFHWIRILYNHPAHIDSELIDTIKKHDKICNYFEIPLQHINDRILKSMNRKISKKRTIDILKEIKTKIPEAIIRTTFIVGYPGETEEEYLELRDFIEEQKFGRLGVFTYSKEEDTRAFNIEEKLTDDEKEFRRDEIMAIQQSISKDVLEDFIGKTLEVIIDKKADESDFQWIGRTYFDSPEIDGYVLINTDKKIKKGEFYKVKIVDSTEYDLIGEI